MKHVVIALGALVLSACAGQKLSDNDGVMEIDKIGLSVGKTENREYSFTDKKAAFWYGRTHQDEPVDWYAGWNVAKQRILSDFVLTVDGKEVKRSEAKRGH